MGNVRFLESANLKELVKNKVVPETISTSLEISNSRRTESDEKKLESLVTNLFYTANVGIYGIENGHPVAMIGGRDEFLKVVVDNIDAFYKDLVSGSGVYRLKGGSESNQFVKDRVSSKDLGKANISNLDLKCHHDAPNGRLSWKTDNYSFNNDQAVLVQVPFGSLGEGGDFDLNMQNMRQFHRAGLNYEITDTGIWVPVPRTVERIFEKGDYKKGDLFAQASLLYSFLDNSIFDADVRYIGSNHAVRGYLI